MLSDRRDLSIDTDILQPQDWSFPVPIAYGPGRLAEIGRKSVELGLLNPLVVTDRGSRDLPFIAALQGYLAQAGLKSGLFMRYPPTQETTRSAPGAQHSAPVAMTGSLRLAAGARWMGPNPLV